MKKYENFELNWNINNYDDFIAALSLFDDWALNGAVNGEEFKVKEIIQNADPDLYDKLSRGDKCRVGRAVSTRFANHYYYGIDRGNDNGATKTYFKFQ